MKYWQRRSKIMKLLSYIAMAGVLVTIFMGLAYYSIIMLLFSFHLGNESEMCKMKGVLHQVVHNQTAMMEAAVEKITK